MEDDAVQSSNKWLEHLSNGLGHELEAITVEGLKIAKAHKGFVRCNFVVSNRILDADGNWHVGAMATLIDDVGAAAIYSFAGHIKASLEFNVSFLSTAKIHEEIELEAKVVGDKGRITSVVIEVRRKSNGNLLLWVSNGWPRIIIHIEAASFKIRPITLDMRFFVLEINRIWVGDGLNCCL